MKVKERIEELANGMFPDEYNIWARPNVEKEMCVHNMGVITDEIIDKAYNWIDNNLFKYCLVNGNYDKDNFLIDFRKAMEE